MPITDQRELHRNRIFGLELIRAVAVAAVLYSHCRDFLIVTGRGEWLPEIFDGVDLFFVLSGFLIGGLLIEIAQRDPSPRAWFRFMVRRWMRTLPAYFVVLVVLLLAWPPALDRAAHAAAYATLTQNLAWPMPSDNWFGTSWSLTVEEWFYLLFSAIFLVGARAFGRRGQWFAIALFLVMPPLARLVIPLSLPWDLYVRKVAVLRLDAIAYGVVLAWLLVEQSALFRFWKLSLVVGLTLQGLVWIEWTYGDAWGWLPTDGLVWRTFCFCFSGVAFGLCFPAALRLIEMRGLTGHLVSALSRQSYAIYLIHYPLLEICTLHVMQGRLPWQMLVPVTLTATWVVSYLSLKLFEGPILERRPTQWPTASLAKPAATFA